MDVLIPTTPISGGNLGSRDVFGRERTIDRIWSLLDESSVIITDLRKIGKTTVLKAMRREPRPGWTIHYLQIEDIKTVEALVARTIAELERFADAAPDEGPRRHRERSLTVTRATVGVKTKHLSGQAELAPELRSDPWAAFSAVMAAVKKKLDKDGQRLVLVWDEFPFALKGIRRTGGDEAIIALLHDFSRLRAMCGPEVRWALTGSLGLQHVLRGLGDWRGFFHGIEMVSLGPLTNADAIRQARSRLLHVGVDDVAVAGWIAEATSGIPSLIDNMIGHLETEPDAVPCSLEEAGALLITVMQRPDVGQQWTPLATRISEYYGERADLANTILDTLRAGPMSLAALAVTLEVAADTVRDTLVWLRDDEYVMLNGGQWRWKHPALRDVWAERRGLLG